MKNLIFCSVPIAVLIIIYLLGPTPSLAEYPNKLPQVPKALADVENYIAEHESKYNIREGCRAEIIWVDSIPQKTEYSLVYLHGFSASHEEGNPGHFALADSLKANLYLTRLHAHGINSQEPLLDFNADSLIRSAQDALAVGQALGEKVILVGTSTGGTLALILAAKHPELVHELVLYSPNIAIADPTAVLLNDPWGLEIANLVLGSNYREYEAPAPVPQFWDTRYRIESLIELEELLEVYMTSELFSTIEQPTFVGYYFKNQEEQDKVVSVAAIEEMYQQLGTKEPNKHAVAFAEVGDHVIASKHKTEHFQKVVDSTVVFLKKSHQ